MFGTGGGGLFGQSAQPQLGQMGQMGMMGQMGANPMMGQMGANPMMGQQMGPNPQVEMQRVCIEADQRIDAMANQVQQQFIAYSYSYTENQQLLQQAHAQPFNVMAHGDYTKWAQAVQNNPDPRSCYPEPLRGMPALEQRVAGQQKALDAASTGMEELDKAFGNLKDHLQSQSQQKLDECRQRHQKLSRQLVQVVAALETYAVHTGAARRNIPKEAELENSFASLEDQVRAPASSRARLEELRAVLRGLRQRGPPPGGALTMTEPDVQRTLQLTEAQGDLLELLQQDLALKKQSVEQVASALERFSPGPQAPGPYTNYSV